MKHTYDVIVIGAGINGLTAAAYLAKAGRRVLVVERRDVLGGVAAPDRLTTGCQVSPCVHDVGWIPRQMVRELDLTRYGFQEMTDGWLVAAARREGGWLTLSDDVTRTAASLRTHSQADGAQWPRFVERMAQLAGFLEALYLLPPPRVSVQSMSDALRLLGLGRRLRGLGKQGMVDLLRTLPMPVAELVEDWFEDDALKGTLAATAVKGVLQGPRSPGTAFLLLHHHVGARAGMFHGRSRVRGGAGALVGGLTAAVTHHGGEILPAVAVAAIRVREERCRGVTLADGREIDARLVLSSADVRATFLHLIDPDHLDPAFVQAVRNIRYRGATAKVTLVLSALPLLRDFKGEGQSPDRLPNIVSIAPSIDTIERAYDDAKYGQVSQVPYLEVAFPPPGDSSNARHVMSVLVQYAPYHVRDWCWDAARRDALGELVVNRLAELFPHLTDVIVDRQVLTPRDLEATYALTEGSLSHGEMALDQILFMRPIPGWAEYRTPIEGLFLCGMGCHPGDGVAGGAGRLAAAAALKTP
ncbi:MAG: FAD-dependent oxidoreductase [Luteitalea sp.]|nr:FAD-dependent oxidoreductase [Luteitalea sp.]